MKEADMQSGEARLCVKFSGVGMVRCAQVWSGLVWCWSGVVSGGYSLTASWAKLSLYLSIKPGIKTGVLCV